MQGAFVKNMKITNESAINKNIKKNLSDKANNRKRFRNDIILIVSFCVIAIIISFFLYYGDSAQKDMLLEITIDGEVVVSYKFNKTDNIRKSFPLDTGNVVIMDKGQIFMESATCPDKLCTRQGKISLSGQSIICLPHKVVVRIKDISDTNIFDDNESGVADDDGLDVMPR